MTTPAATHDVDGDGSAAAADDNDDDDNVGVKTPIRVVVGPCALGRALVGHRGRGLCVALMGDDDTALLADARDRFGDVVVVDGTDDGIAHGLLRRLQLAIDAPHREGAPVTLDLTGTTFQRQVWQAIVAIPTGQTITYTALATRLGLPPSSSRAVAAACGANPVAVLVPCHRVIRADGSLAGYRWGLGRKRTLLATEAAARPGALL